MEATQHIPNMRYVLCIRRMKDDAVRFACILHDLPLSTNVCPRAVWTIVGGFVPGGYLINANTVLLVQESFAQIR